MFNIIGYFLVNRLKGILSEKSVDFPTVVLIWHFGKLNIPIFNHKQNKVYQNVGRDCGYGTTASSIPLALRCVWF